MVALQGAGLHINIISRSLRTGASLGPSKVIRNTIRGLELIGVNISLNEDIHQFDINWVHDDLRAYAHAVAFKKPILFGPNLVANPKELPFRWRKPANGSICLVPSAWVAKAWSSCTEFDRLAIEVWAAGIDTQTYRLIQKNDNKNESFVLIYFKNRNKIDLDYVVQKLVEKNIPYRIFAYGAYEEFEYLESIRAAKYAIWLSGTESQGFAIMEALSTSLPILVLDCLNINDNVLDETIVSRPRFPKTFYKILATSSPYFDERCGLKIYLISEIDQAINEMEKKLPQFNPREYILEKHSLILAAENLASIAKNLPCEKGNKSKLLPLSKGSISLMFFFERVINGGYMRTILAQLRKYL
jgi:hypothetical protein